MPSMLRKPFGKLYAFAGTNHVSKPESTEESWYLCRSVGEGRGKVAVRV